MRFSVDKGAVLDILKIGSRGSIYEKAKISGAYLSEIESGRKEGSVSVLKRIAAAPSIDLNDLV